MYDNAPYDAKRHLMQLADVGTMSLFVADCDALADIATILHHDDDARELRARQKKYGDRLQSLWDEKSGQFLNRNLVTGELSPRTSPTNFYPLLARVATKQQAERMVREHLLNPKEFWGTFVIPSTPRNDPSFADNDYWRGRIWGPMNFLVYLGLRNYDFPEVRAEFADKSTALFRGEWTAKHHVHENYNATTGEGDDTTGSDPFYHWGALLMLTSAMERGEF
jgi:neutral trehalase